MLCPLMARKSRRVLLILVHELGSALAIRIRSSAKNRSDRFGPFPAILIGFLHLLWTALLMFDKYSIHNIKIYGDIGSPCRIPLEGSKNYVRIPFTSIDTLLVVIHDMIMEDNLGGKLKD